MLWYGIEIAVVQNAIEKYVYMIVYTTLKRYHAQYIRGGTTTIHNNDDPYQSLNVQTTETTITVMLIHILYGYIAQWVHLPITIPLETWKTQVQLYNNSSHRHPHHPPCNNVNGTTWNPTNPKWDIFYQMISPPDPPLPDSGTTDTSTKKTFPLLHLYSGVLSSYIILCWKPAIQYTIYESIRRIRIQQKQGLYPKEHNNNNYHGRGWTTSSRSSHISWMESWIIAIFARTVATIVVYPYLRRRLLSQLPMKPTEQQDPASSTTVAVMIPTTLPTTTTITKVEGMKTMETEYIDDNGEDTCVTTTLQQQHNPPSSVSSRRDDMLIRVRKCVLQWLLSPTSQIISIQFWIRNAIRQHFDVTSYYGIGPELIRGAISSVISSFVQEYILRWTVQHNSTTITDNQQSNEISQTLSSTKTR
jgi:hypothetical protein